MATAGRKTKLTKKTIAAIEQALLAGNYIKPTLAYLGIGQSTYYAWIEKGKQDVDNSKSSIYQELVDTVERASAQAEMMLVQVLAKAALGNKEAGVPADPKWALEVLKRRHNDNWGDRVKEDIDQNVKGGMSVELVTPQDDYFDRLEEIAEMVRNRNE